MNKNTIKVLFFILFAILIPLAANAQGNKDCLYMYGGSLPFKNGMGEIVNNNPDAAITCLNEEIRIHPENGLAYLYLAIAYKDKNDIRNAADYALKAEKKLGGKDNKPYKAQCYSLLGDIWMDLGDYFEAARNYYKAISLDYKDPEYYEQISEAYHALGSQLGIKDYAREMMKLFPDNPYGYFSMGKYLLLYKKDSPSALEYLNKALEKDPDYARAKDFKAIILMDNGQWDEAFDLLFAALDNGSTAALARVSKLRGEDYERLEKYIKNHPEEYKTKWQYPFVLEELYVKNGMYDKAKSTIHDLLALDAKPGEYAMLAICNIMTGNLSKALEAIDMAIAESPDDSEYVVIKSRIFLLAGQTEKAKEVLDKYIEKYPEISETLFEKAIVNHLSGNYDQSMEILDHLLDRYPKDITVIYEKGLLHLMLGQDEEAMKWFKKASKLTNKGGVFSKMIGATAYARLGDAKKATSIIEDLLSEYPYDGVTHYYAANVYAILGNDDEALKHLKLAHSNGEESMLGSLYDYDFRKLRENKAFSTLIDNLMPGLKEPIQPSTLPSNN